MNNDEKLELKNAEGKRLLQKTKYDYSNAIINNIKENPDIYDKLLYETKLTSKEFLNYVSGDVDANIVVFDNLLVQSRKLIKEKNKK